MSADTIRLANERMSIFDACALAGTDVASYSAGTIKSYCPFGDLFHADGGVSKAFRIYPDTNSAYCFAGCGAYRPVNLVAQVKDLTPDEAAEWILTETGYVEPHYLDKWEAVVNKPDEIDPEQLAEALKFSCRAANPNWDTLQFETDVAEKFTLCLSLLAKVRSSADAKTWLDGTKRLMSATLEGRT